MTFSPICVYFCSDVGVCLKRGGIVRLLIPPSALINFAPSVTLSYVTLSYVTLSYVTLSLCYTYSIHHVVASAVRRSIRRTPEGRTVSSTAQEL